MGSRYRYNDYSHVLLGPSLIFMSSRFCFQKRPAPQGAAGSDGGHVYRLPTCREYFRDLFYRVEVNFVDKNIPNDPGFILTLSQRTQYDQMVEAVAKHLQENKTHLQFFKSANYR